MSSISIVINIFSILAGWLITHCYYKKSLKNQEKQSTNDIKIWKSLVNENDIKNSQDALRLEYIDKGVAEYNHAGTPVRVINTFNIPNAYKAEIYDAVMMRVKGRLGISNPYRK